MGMDRGRNYTSDRGAIYIVGIGPGGIEHLTSRAREVIESCDVVVGYSTYIGLVREIIPDKEIVSTGMTEEVERCRHAIMLAYRGRRVAVISSGDPGIYGMAGLIFEIIRHEGIDKGGGIEIQVIPGIPAFCAAAALLGAPVMHDFASISLSDLLTPWDTILRRVEAATKADFVIVLYNPRSRKRQGQLREALDIVSNHREMDTPAGIVHNATRDGEKVIVTTLKGIDEYYDEIGMTSIIIIGNNDTFIDNDRMVTPRGYRLEG